MRKSQTYDCGFLAVMRNTSDTKSIEFDSLNPLPMFFLFWSMQQQP